MKNIFYTYIYLDPRKPGTYQYGDYTFDYEPFYVGKGKEQQYTTHLNEAKKDNQLSKGYNIHKYSKIKKILREYSEPTVIKVKENISEQEAFDLEIWLIWSIGRSDLGLGPLTNHTYGGEGASGHITSQETKQKLSDIGKGRIVWNKGKKSSDETKIKSSASHKGKKNPMFGKTHSNETKIKMSDLRKGKIPWNKGKTNVYTEEVKQKMRESQIGEKHHMFGNHHSNETRRKISKTSTGKPKTEEAKRNMKEAWIRRKK